MLARVHPLYGDNPALDSVLRIGRAAAGERAILRARPMECVVCQVSDQDSRLSKCPICFKWVCDNCANRRFGRIFCTQKCADQFFFGDDEE